MSTIGVSLLHSRFRLPRGAVARDWLARIDAIQSVLVDTHLEPALAPFAMTDEMICVRRIALPLRLRGAVTDWQMSVQWSALIADELQRILARNAPEEVLRFPHELAARQAFLADALGGSGERDWAWTQLGWLPAGAEPSSRDRLDAAIASGISAAAAVVPLLRGVAAAGLLPALAHALDERQRDRLLIAALAAHPHAAESLVRWVVDGARGVVEATLPPGSPPTTLLGLVFLAVLREISDQREQRAWATLAVLCVEPHRLHAAPDEAAAIAAAWVRHAAAPSPVARSRRPDAPAETPKRLVSAPKRPGISRPAAPVTPMAEQAAPRRQSASAADAASPGAGAEPEERPLATLGPVEGETAFGGLLFLLPLVAETGALEMMLAEPVLTGWPLAASLHRLALTLLPPLRATDAAALAFAGLPPNAVPPDAMQPDDWRRPPDEAAAAALGAAATLVVDEVSARLPQWAGRALVQRVAERWAVVAADPGWIEVRLRMADLSVELRRAALDLDPGFLPWLGIVLRYRYA